MNSRPRLVIFDVDGTLVDSQAHIMAAPTRAFEGEGLATPARAAVLGCVGLSLPVLMARIAPEADAGLQARLIAGYRQGYGDLRAEGAEDLSPLYPGARDALDALAGRDDVLLAVATGKSRRGMAHLIAQHGLEGMFQSIQTADDHPSKPSPEMLRACLVETGVDALDATILGDTAFDMEMGRNAGVHALGVTWGYHDKNRLFQGGASEIIDDFTGVIPALERRWRLQ